MLSNEKNNKAKTSGWLFRWVCGLGKLAVNTAVVVVVTPLVGLLLVKIGCSPEQQKNIGDTANYLLNKAVANAVVANDVKIAINDLKTLVATFQSEYKKETYNESDLNKRYITYISPDDQETPLCYAFELPKVPFPFSVRVTSEKYQLSFDVSVMTTENNIPTNIVFVNLGNGIRITGGNDRWEIEYYPNESLRENTRKLGAFKLMKKEDGSYSLAARNQEGPPA